MEAIATGPKLAHAERAAQQIAARGRGNAYVVAASGPRGYDVETGSEPPRGKHVVAVYLSGGKKGTVHGHAPRECRKAYDVYERSNPVAPIGTIKGQTRGEAYGLARQAHPDVDLVLGVAGPGSRDEVVRILEREEKKAREEADKAKRRQAREMKEREREQLAKSREFHAQWKAEQEAKAARIEAEDARRRPLGLPTGHDPEETISTRDTAAFIAASRAATDAAIKAALAQDDEPKEEHHQAVTHQADEEPAAEEEPAQAPVPEFDLAAAIAENDAIRARTAAAALARSEERKARLDPKIYKPYAYEFRATIHDGSEQMIARVGSSVTTAEKSALRNPKITAVEFIQPLSERQYSNAYGSRKAR